jgi:predicted DNA-binding antitoxin AbrB/MazE fold protein
MALPKKNSAAEEKVQAVYEKGALRPLRPLHLKERTRVLVTLHAQLPWRKELETLLRRMKARSKSIPQKLVDAEVTRARAEVKAKRRAARRSS